MVGQEDTGEIVKIPAPQEYEAPESHANERVGVKVDPNNPDPSREQAAYEAVTGKGAGTPYPADEFVQKVTKHFIPSVGEELSAFGRAVSDPATTLHSMWELGTGALSKTMHPGGIGQFAGTLGQAVNLGHMPTEEETKGTWLDPSVQAKNEAPINALISREAPKFSSFANFERALAEDPAGVLSTATIPFTGGETALGKAPGLLGKTARIAGKVGYLDPAQSALGLARGAYGGIGGITRAGQSLVSGSPWRALKTAEDTIANASPTDAWSFVKHYTGMGDHYEIVNSLKEALKKYKAEQYANWNGMRTKAFGNNPPPLSFNEPGTSIDDALNRAITATSGPAGVGSPGFRTALNNAVHGPNGLVDLVNSFKANPAWHTMEGFDALRENVGHFLNDADPKVREYAGRVYGAVRGTMTKMSPEYSQVLQSISEARNKINDLSQTLIGGKNATATKSTEASLKALGTSKGNNLLNDLAKHDSRIPYMLSGAALNEWLPSNVGKVVDLAGALGSGAGIYMQPHLWPQILGSAATTLASTSPKLAGFMNMMSGAFKRATTPFSSPTGVKATTQIGREQKRQDIEQGKEKIDPTQYVDLEKYNSSDRTGRASGGKVDADMHEKLVNRLMNMAKQAKKVSDKTTEPLLNAPDEAIVKALGVAQEAI